MEQITHYTTLLKGILDTNPWIWHGIQMLILLGLLESLDFLSNVFGIKSLNKLRFFYFIEIYLLSIILITYNVLAIWGILLLLITNAIKSNYIFYRINIRFQILVIFLVDIINFITIFSISTDVNYKYKLILILIWVVYFVRNMLALINIYKIESGISHGMRLNFVNIYNPLYISLILIPNSWYIWSLLIFNLFLGSANKYPIDFLCNDGTLIDDLKKSQKRDMYVLLIPSIIVMLFFGPNINSFFCILIYNVLRATNNFTSIFTILKNPIKNYVSFSLLNGNFNFIDKVKSHSNNKLLLLVQRISIKISDLKTYGILVSPYEKVLVKHREIKTLSELAINSHHLIILDGGEASDKIIKIENDIVQFLGRVDTVIDCFTIANQTIDDYSEPIEEEHAACVRERIAIKQGIIDEKPFELEDNPEEETKTIDTFINSINTESVRINMLVREYFKDNTLDYHLLQNDLANNGPFEINTLLRQMREGGSVPSRFVDALSIAEVAARYLFSLTNEVNNYLNKNENSIEDRNAKYTQLSFGPCVGFLRTISEKGKLNAFEKSIKELLKTKYTDNNNFERLRKYLITDLHYDKKVSDEPTLFDLFNYLAYIRNKTRGHGTPSKVEFEFYVTLDLISIFIVNCISKIEIETFSRQTINEKEWLLYYNAGGNVVLHPLEPNENLEYWKDSFDWKYLDKMEEAKNQIDETNQSVYFKIKHQDEIHWIKAETYFKCKEGIIYMYDGINNNEAEWISFTTGAVIRPYRIN